jgi:Flp pilus assembly protein CpaB
MTSRLSAIALIFAVFSTASLAVATTLRHDAVNAPAAKQVRVIELERVVVTAKRLPREAR